MDEGVRDLGKSLFDFWWCYVRVCLIWWYRYVVLLFICMLVFIEVFVEVIENYDFGYIVVEDSFV